MGKGGGGFHLSGRVEPGKGEGGEESGCWDGI